jgi:hypothetical protein
MTVYLPAAYDGKKKFPVMYLLHGHGGDETAWGDLGRASQIMDNLIAAGKAVPMIVVMPNGNPTCNAFWNIVITQIEYLQGEIGRLYQQRALAGGHLDVGFSQQVHCVVIQTTFRLYCYS